MTEDLIRYGNNWYTHVGNNPVSYIDPSGLEPVYTNGEPSDVGSGWSVHSSMPVVEPGGTLWNLAGRFGKPQDWVRIRFKGNPRQLRIGQTVNIQPLLDKITGATDDTGGETAQGGSDTLSGGPTHSYATSRSLGGSTATATGGSGGERPSYSGGIAFYQNAPSTTHWAGGNATLNKVTGGLDTLNGNFNLGASSTAFSSKGQNTYKVGRHLAFGLGSNVTAGSIEAFAGIKDGSVGASAEDTVASVSGNFSVTWNGYGLRLGVGASVGAGGGVVVGMKELEVKAAAFFGAKIFIQVVTPNEQE